MTSSTETNTNIDRWVMKSGLSAHTLAGDWYACPVEEFRQGFYQYDEDGWVPITVPAHWQQHPDLAGHSGRVVYRHHFSTPPPPEEARMAPEKLRTWLRLNGSFYWTEPYINGSSLEQHEGYFEPYEREITRLLEDDLENVLLVEVDCPDEHNKNDKRMITGIFSHWDCFDPAANPGGLWLPVELIYSGPVRLQCVRCRTESISADLAQISYTADVDAAAAGAAVLRWTITPRTFSGAVQTIEQRRMLRTGTQTVRGLFKLRDPRLWWTHDLGNPELYTITLEIFTDETISDRYSFGFGVRQFELRNWIPHLNGIRFLAKGNNYAPGDMRVATMTTARYEQDLHLACDCNMNFLRVHAHVDHPAFYDAADAAGILLWQDLPLQWLYRAEVLPEAQRQVRAMIRLLHNHPAIGVWCMHNEALFVGTTSDESLPTRLRTYSSSFGFSWNRDTLDTQLKQVAEKEDPQRPVVRSSGEFYVPFWRSGTDSHAYFGWYSSYGTLDDLERLRKRLPLNMRFVTEFGAQSFPNVESCLKFMPADIAEIDFDELAQRHSFQPDVMSKWLPWREAASLEELVEMTQDYQIFINRYYIDRLRYHKYRPTGGIVPFVFLDPYPAILWSIIDYWRVPKRSYYAMRMAFNPQYAFTLFVHRIYRIAEPIDLPIYIVNDAQYPVHHVHINARLFNPDGELIAEVTHVLSLDADCLAQEIDRLRLTPSTEGCYKLKIDLTEVELETHQVYDIEVR
jgi:beta-mannosidase